MGAYRLSPEAEADLDSIWLDYVAFIADDYLVIYRVSQDESVIILRVLHGSRDLSALFEP